MSRNTSMDRRDFIRLGTLAGSGLLLGVYVPGGTRRWLGDDATAATSLQPNAFVQVDTDGTVTIWSARSDMGQGVRTAMPMIVADELDADWSTVHIRQADAHPTQYGRMMTVGSSSVRGNAWMALRQAGRHRAPDAGRRRSRALGCECGRVPHR